MEGRKKGSEMVRTIQTIHHLHVCITFVTFLSSCLPSSTLPLPMRLPSCVSFGARSPSLLLELIRIRKVNHWKSGERNEATKPMNEPNTGN